MRRRVLVAAGAGLTHEEIALALGIHRNTLRKHYFAELHQAAAIMRMEMLCGILQAALAGKVGAARMYLKHAPNLHALKGTLRP